MTEAQNRAKWNRAAVRFDLMTGFGPERRWEPAKRALYANMRGRVLFVAAGTGLEFRMFPAGAQVTAIDISDEMLARARPRAEAANPKIGLVQTSAQGLPFPDGSFDQIYTACTFCSVIEPVAGLRELRRVLRADGELYMFEHTGSRWPPFNLMLHLMNPVTRLGGPEVNRDTVGNVIQAGFVVHDVRGIFLDVVKTIHARPAASP